MRRVALIFVLILFVGCYNAADKPIISGDVELATSTVANLRSDIIGTAPTRINDDVVIVGRVVSSDRDENFYRSIVVDDGTGAVEVLLGLSPLESLYPEGLRVALHIKGCYVAYVRGVLQVGAYAPSYESYAIGYLMSREVIDDVVRRSTDVCRVEPRAVTIARLTSEDCGRLFRVDDLYVVASTSIDTSQGETLADARWCGYSLFKDVRGDSIALFTRDYARFAESRIPSGNLSIVGVLEWAKYDGGKECYQLRMRYEEDCSLR